MAGDPLRFSGSLKPISADAFGPRQAQRLLWRAGFGGTPAQVRIFAEWGPEQAVDSLLNVEEALTYPKPSANDFADDIMREPTEEERREAIRARRAQDEDSLARLRLLRQDRERIDRRQMAQMQRWWLTRMIETSRPLEEKMTLFWHGHFATSYRTIENSYHMFMQNELFRRHAVGSFADLLHAIIRDPAMLAYLDNNDSRKGRPNENLARELLELFSLSEGAYSERDIKEGARALTGYTFEGNQFKFRAERHDDGAKSILGRTGRLKGEDLVDAIMNQSACADFIAFKVYEYFIGGVPPKGDPNRESVVRYIRALAGTLRSSRYEMKPMLRRMLLSEQFYEHPDSAGRIKSPTELIVGAIRSLRTPTRDLGILLDAMDLMGQNLFYPPSVKGWDGGRAWINTSTLFVRVNVLNFLLTGRTPKGYDALADVETFDAQGLLEGADRTTRNDPALLADHLLRMSLCVKMDPVKVAALADFIRSRDTADPTLVIAPALSLICTAPEYQLC